MYFLHPQLASLDKGNVYSLSPQDYEECSCFCMKIRFLEDEPSEDDTTCYIWAPPHKVSVATMIGYGHFFANDWCMDGSKSQLWLWSPDRQSWELI
jgi:hypothetical protein